MYVHKKPFFFKNSEKVENYNFFFCSPNERKTSMFFMKRKLVENIKIAEALSKERKKETKCLGANKRIQGVEVNA